MLGAGATKQRLAFLDVARGLAALLVLAEHALGAFLPDLWRPSPAHGFVGRTGVILFLIISGFIIPTSLEQGGSNSRFWLRRAFRLFPAYWLCIAVACGYSSSEQFRANVPPLRLGDWLLNLTMLQGFFGRPHVSGVFWTLQIELVVYVVCSLLYAAGLLRRVRFVAWLALAGYAAVGLTRPILEGEPFGIGGQRFLYFAPLVGFVAQRYFVGLLGRRPFVVWVTCLAGAVTAIWFVNHALFPAGMTAACLWECGFTWGSAGGCFFVLLAARDRTMPSAACRLGRISFSVYPPSPVRVTPCGSGPFARRARDPGGAAGDTPRCRVVVPAGRTAGYRPRAGHRTTLGAGPFRAASGGAAGSMGGIIRGWRRPLDFRHAFRPLLSATGRCVPTAPTRALVRAAVLSAQP